MTGIIGLLKKHWKAFLENPWQARYLVLLLVINLFGSAYGYYWYWEQLTTVPRKFLLFVPDSPLATTLLTVVLLLSLLGWRNPLLNVIAFTANIKYGLWAVIIISDNWLSGGAIEFNEVMLWFSHLGMAAQGVVYLRGILHNHGLGWVTAATVAWMILNDFVDYRFGVYPYLYYWGQETVAAATAYGLTAVIGVALAFKLRNKL